MTFQNIFKKENLKAALFLLGILLVISSILYSQNLINILKDNATEYINFRIKVFEANINNPVADIDAEFLFTEVIQGAYYPLIYTDPNHNPVSWKNIDPELDNKPLEQFTHHDSLLLWGQLQEMSRENDPIPIMYQDSITFGYYYYGYAPVIYKLRMFPYIAIGSALLFIILGYLGFSYIKKSEQQFIWVGMAKETAHQLGTPLSSISGWLELLLLNSEKREQAFAEIKNDLDRLKKIANRFSKIGSTPAVKPVNLASVIDNVVGYFQKRLPNMQKRVLIETTIDKNISVNLNPDLFEWVLENLIKNALDSIENQQGIIKITARLNPDRSQAYIDVSDNGKGVPAHNRKQIFKPGFSTKKRGWGLGLSLALRIVKEYHHGKLLLLDSRSGVGTTFRIILDRS